MKNNRHEDAIPEATLKQVYGQIEAVKTALATYTLALTPQERRAMLKMGDKSLAFVEKTHDYASDNPSLAPAIWTWTTLTRILATLTDSGDSSRLYTSLMKWWRTRSW
jgi:hypothetical protein